ncbi:MAG: PspC domain-containing protein [Chloroflexota bacterium]|jgi:phage shock protein PspC (stress-responsive transcriptional regulator)|nr:PspC domain-containing protein [Chloroflexota bacterium]
MNGQLTRSPNAMIGGVAAGVATWINADPALVRIAWALLVPLTGGAALLAYVVAWVVVPEASVQPQSADSVAPASEDARPRPVDDGRTALFIGGGLVLVGLYFLVREYLPRIDWGFVWPLILVGVGALILVGAARRR